MGTTRTGRGHGPRFRGPDDEGGTSVALGTTEGVLVAVVNLEGQDVERRSVDRTPVVAPAVGDHPAAVGAGTLGVVLERQHRVDHGLVPRAPVLVRLLGRVGS